MIPLPRRSTTIACGEPSALQILPGDHDQGKHSVKFPLVCNANQLRRYLLPTEDKKFRPTPGPGSSGIQTRVRRERSEAEESKFKECCIVVCSWEISRLLFLTRRSGRGCRSGSFRATGWCPFVPNIRRFHVLGCESARPTLHFRVDAMLPSLLPWGFAVTFGLDRRLQ